MFSGGTYEEVARWLWNFLMSHAKREHPAVEVILDAGDEREGKSYGVQFALRGRTSPPLEFDYREVADQRGNLAWCRELAERARAEARGLIGAAGRAGAR